jgi:hypothetical protein
MGISSRTADGCVGHHRFLHVGITTRERRKLSIAASVIAVFGMGFSLLGIIGGVLF